MAAADVRRCAARPSLWARHHNHDDGRQRSDDLRPPGDDRAGLRLRRRAAPRHDHHRARLGRRFAGPEEEGPLTNGPHVTVGLLYEDPFLAPFKRAPTRRTQIVIEPLTPDIRDAPG